MVQQAYIPALTFHWLTPLYDLILSRLFPEAKIKRQVAVRAAGTEQRLLDLGCGTGTLAIMLRQVQTGGLIAGIDVDGEMLLWAGLKAQHAHIALALTQGHAELLPFASGSFDAVISSLVLHHLNRSQKLAALREVQRVLRPGGMLFIADFGPPDTIASNLVSRITRRFEEVADNIDGLLPGLIAAAGFADVTKFGRVMTFMGTVALLQGTKSRK